MALSPNCKQQLDLEVTSSLDGDIFLECPGCKNVHPIPELTSVMFIVQAARQFKHAQT